MENKSLDRRRELALTLLSELKNVYMQFNNTAREVEKSSNDYYEKAYEEDQVKLSSVMENYHNNVEKIREINKEITTLINSWYQFVKDEKETGKLSFPIKYFVGKRSLNKKITGLNKEITSITINNRFIKENLSMLLQQLEMKAVCLAKSGGNYLEFEKILLKYKDLISELKYLLPTIPGLCPVDITSSGIENSINKLEAVPYS